MTKQPNNSFINRLSDTDNMSTSKCNKCNLTYLPLVLSYSMTAVRLLIAIKICGNLISKAYNDKPILIMLGLIIILDIMDGKVFELSRIYGIESKRRIRRVLDSTVDRISIILICLSLLMIDESFIYVCLILLIKESITSYYCIIAFFNGFVLNSNNYGKFSSFVVAASVGLAVIGNTFLSTIFAFCSLIIGFFAMLKYKTSFQLVKSSHSGPL